MKKLRCMAIDDDPLFMRKLELYISQIEWLSFEKGVNNPVQGATAVLTVKPDVLFLDVEMPFMNGDDLASWIQPKLAQIDPPPRIIVVSSLTNPPEELLKNAAGFINKSKVIDPEFFEEALREILL
jgi:DNA-binding NarL/FixJ family response regulator